MLKVSEIISYKKSYHKIPFYASKIKAGFASPAENYIQNKLSLDELLVNNPNTTYFVRVSGESMKDLNILDGDLLIVDASLTPKNKSIVIASINNELLVKQYLNKSGKIILKAANDDYPEIELSQDNENICWGVVIHVIHSY